MAAAALFVAFAAAGCGAPSVKTVRAEKSAQPFVYEEEAPAEALHAMTVTPRVSGPILTEIPAEGTAVRAGQLLVQIDTAEYAAQKAELQQRIASSGAARAAAPSAGNSLADSLLKRGSSRRRNMPASRRKIVPRLRRRGARPVKRRRLP